ncbi:hypothetical protein GX48_06948 [Paracoccidioides brasiliensis]|nr:hypothetical protein GX48_06948 [Paracoccidioides brasiliensis]
MSNDKAVDIALHQSVVSPEPAPDSATNKQSEKEGEWSGVYENTLPELNPPVDFKSRPTPIRPHATHVVVVGWSTMVIRHLKQHRPVEQLGLLGGLQGLCSTGSLHPLKGLSGGL